MVNKDFQYTYIHYIHDVYFIFDEKNIRMKCMCSKSSVYRLLFVETRAKEKNISLN